jgi:hypothetical protein
MRPCSSGGGWRGRSESVEYIVWRDAAPRSGNAGYLAICHPGSGRASGRCSKMESIPPPAACTGKGCHPGQQRAREVPSKLRASCRDWRSSADRSHRHTLLSRLFGCAAMEGAPAELRRRRTNRSCSRRFLFLNLSHCRDALPVACYGEAVVAGRRHFS